MYSPPTLPNSLPRSIRQHHAAHPPQVPRRLGQLPHHLHPARVAAVLEPGLMTVAGSLGVGGDHRSAARRQVAPLAVAPAVAGELEQVAVAREAPSELRAEARQPAAAGEQQARGPECPGGQNHDLGAHASALLAGAVEQLEIALVLLGRGAQLHLLARRHVLAVADLVAAAGQRPGDVEHLAARADLLASLLVRDKLA